VAERAIALHSKRPSWQRLFRASGYDTEQRLLAYASVAPAGAKAFVAGHPVSDKIPTGFIECRAVGQDLGVPFRLLDFAFPEADLARDSDGFIPCESQAFGQKLGTYKLDHFAQMGFALQLTRLARQRCREEFIRMRQNLFKRFVATSAKKSNSTETQNQSIRQECS
jgi:hypothetical protein